MPMPPVANQIVSVNRFPFEQLPFRLLTWKDNKVFDVGVPVVLDDVPNGERYHDQSDGRCDIQYCLWHVL